MRKIIAALGVSAMLLSSAPLMACGMDKDGDAKGSVEKQTWSKPDKGGKWAKKAAKKEQASKTERGKAKL